VRYWHRLDEKSNDLTTSYLPEIEYDDISRIVYREFQTLKDLEGVRCLILLGEPGIGKSAAVEGEIRRLQELGVQVDSHDLKAYGDSAHLERRIFKSDAFKSLSAGKKLVLVLDSLDEGRIVIENLGPMLLDEFREHLADQDIRSRLSLRITCRSAEWPASLTEKLEDFFGKENTAVWHLTQLRRSDVCLAAKDLNLDSQGFLTEIEALGAVPLAIRPVTLQLLLKLKGQEGGLPSKRTDLYRRGLELLCSETNDERLEIASERSSGRLDAQLRLAIARRIAALSIFCQRPFVAVSGQEPSSDTTILQLSDICPIGSTETDGRGFFEFTSRDVQEVLGSGLFRRIGLDRVGWSHQTYCEFLAAEYLVLRAYTESQVRSLLMVGNDFRIAPQLHETSAWLASMDSVFSRTLLSADPSVLLRSDLLAGEPSFRSAIASSYLQAIERRDLNEGDLWQYYYRLASDDLGTIVRQYICKADCDPIVLRTALTICRDCRIEGLFDCLTEIALSPAQPFSIRRLAIQTLKNSDSAIKAKLRSLLADADDEVHANVLQLLWPGEISTEEMFRFVRPANQNMIGTYDSFIGTELLGLLSESDLSIALHWMANFVRRYPHPEEARSGGSIREFHSLHKLLKGIYERAIRAPSVSSLSDAICATVRALIENSEWLWELSGRAKEYRLVPDSEQVRREIAMQLFHDLAGHAEASGGLVWNIPYIIQSDFDWLLCAVLDEPDAKVRALEVEILFMIRDHQSYDQFKALYAAGDKCPELEERRYQLSGYIELDSPTAKFLSAKETKEGNPKRDRRPESLEAIRLKVSRYLHDLEEKKYSS